MSPMLRGEALPLAPRELAELRESMLRDYGDAVVSTASGPILAIRVPHREPDFLRDLEAAVDQMPYRDLKGFRSAVLVGDRAHLGVSIEMVRALLEGREQSERDWMAALRVQLEPWAFHIGRLPSDPQRRLRAVFRTETESVEDLEEEHFRRLAQLLPQVKAASPGQNRPAYAYLVAHVDHVRLDGAAFFTELEARRRRDHDVQSARRRLELEEKHDLAVAHLERILRQRGAPPAPSPPVPRPPDLPPLRVERPPTRTVEARPVAPPVPPPAAAPDDPFRAAARHPEEVAALRHALQQAGYRTKERLVVQGQPVVLAAARPDGYPSRVLIAFYQTFTADDARGLLSCGRGVHAELVLAVADEVAPGTERVTVATNLKVIAPDEVAAVRFG